MLKYISLLVLLITSTIFAQTDKELDSLIKSVYTAIDPSSMHSKFFHFDCMSTTLFPSFALNNINPQMYGNEECFHSCNCIYNKLIGPDKTIHIIIAANSYNLYNDKIPNLIIYRLFYFAKENNKWIMEKPFVTISFYLVCKNPLQYAPTETRKYKK